MITMRRLLATLAAAVLALGVAPAVTPAGAVEGDLGARGGGRPDQ